MSWPVLRRSGNCCPWQFLSHRTDVRLLRSRTRFSFIQLTSGPLLAPDKVVC